MSGSRVRQEAGFNKGIIFRYINQFYRQQNKSSLLLEISFNSCFQLFHISKPLVKNKQMVNLLRTCRRKQIILCSNDLTELILW